MTAIVYVGETKVEPTGNGHGVVLTNRYSKDPKKHRAIMDFPHFAFREGSIQKFTMYNEKTRTVQAHLDTDRFIIFHVPVAQFNAAEGTCYWDLPLRASPILFANALEKLSGPLGGRILDALEVWLEQNSMAEALKSIPKEHHALARSYLEGSGDAGGTFNPEAALPSTPQVMPALEEVQVALRVLEMKNSSGGFVVPREMVDRCKEILSDYLRVCYLRPDHDNIGT